MRVMAVLNYSLLSVLLNSTCLPLSLPFLNKLSDPLALVWLLMHISSVFLPSPVYAPSCVTLWYSLCTCLFFSPLFLWQSVKCLGDCTNMSVFKGVILCYIKVSWSFEINKFSLLWKHTVTCNFCFSPKKEWQILYYIQLHTFIMTTFLWCFQLGIKVKAWYILIHIDTIKTNNYSQMWYADQHYYS